MPRPEETLFPSKRERTEDRRKERQQRKLQDEFFDHATLLAISRLVTQGQFDQLDFPISTGKEGGVFRASSQAGYRAVKVYRIGNAIFRRLPPYAVEELRREASDRNFGKMVYAWTRREHTVLRRLRTASVRCPEPYGYYRNVLVMDLVGTDGVPAPRLQNVRPDDPEALYEELVEQLRRMFHSAHLVHGDLSPYNVLYHEGVPVLIDVAQAIPTTHPQAAELLERDVRHFATFLRRAGAKVDGESFLTRVRAAPDDIASAEEA